MSAPTTTPTAAQVAASDPDYVAPPEIVSTCPEWCNGCERLHEKGWDHYDDYSTRSHEGHLFRNRQAFGEYVSIALVARETATKQTDGSWTIAYAAPFLALYTEEGAGRSSCATVELDVRTALAVAKGLEDSAEKLRDVFFLQI